MTDQELIKALRVCYTGGGCKDCVYEQGGMDCIDVNPEYAADRLEALLAEVQKQICKRSELEREIGRLEVQVEHLKAGKDTNVPTKWVSADELLPKLTEKEIAKIKRHGAAEAPEFIVMIKGATVPTVLMFDGEKWCDDKGIRYCVTLWCPLPELPRNNGGAENA